MRKVVVYHHRMQHWIYAACTTFLMLAIIMINNHFGYRSWVFDLTIVLLWFIGSGRAALYWIRDDRFVGSVDEAVRWLKEKDLEGMSRD